MNIRQRFLEGLAIPAMPLALDAAGDSTSEVSRRCYVTTLMLVWGAWRWVYTPLSSPYAISPGFMVSFCRLRRAPWMNGRISKADR